MPFRKSLLSSILAVISLLLAAGMGEGFLRLKNANMQNYDIEMWRYSKELKQKSPNPVLGHEHRPGSSAVLQSVNIRINNQGLRGDELAPKQAGERRILLLGSSITLGWGVKEEETLAQRLNRMFETTKHPVKVLNAGIGNYNAVRYVERFLTRLKDLGPDLIVVNYFINDAEVLEFSEGNWFLRNSQFAVTLWTAYNRLFKSSGETTLAEHYRSVYDAQSQGYQEMTASLKKLSEYARARHIPVVLAMTPDIHNLKDYPYDYIHKELEQLSSQLGFVYLDLLPAFKGKDATSLWNMPGDPHHNSLGHELMAESLFPVLEKTLIASASNPRP